MESPAYVKALTRKLSGLFNDEVTSDCLVTVDKTVYFTHRFVLSLWSEPLSHLLQEEDTEDASVEKGESSKKSIRIRDSSPDNVKAFLQFLYTGDLMLKKDNVEQILDLAHRYEISELSQKCGVFLKDRLEVSNCCDTILLLNKYHHLKGSPLQASSESMLLNNIEKCMMSPSFCELPLPVISEVVRSDRAETIPKVVYDALVKYVGDLQKVKPALALFEEINFPGMPLQALKDCRRAWEGAAESAHKPVVLEAIYNGLEHKLEGGAATDSMTLLPGKALESAKSALKPKPKPKAQLSRKGRPKIEKEADWSENLLVGGEPALHYMTPELQYLRVFLEEGVVPAFDVGGTTDPYVLVKMGKSEGKSNIEAKTLTPRWKQEVIVGTYAGSVNVGEYKLDEDLAPTNLKLVVRDLDAVADEDIAEVLIPVSEIPGFDGKQPKKVDAQWYNCTSLGSMMHDIFSLFTIDMKNKKKIDRMKGRFVQGSNQALAGLREGQQEQQQPPAECQVRASISFQPDYCDPNPTTVGSFTISLKSLALTCKDVCSPYVVMQFGKHWIRTPTSLETNFPVIGREYTFKISEPTTLCTVAVFDDRTVGVIGGDDVFLGKFRVRAATLPRNCWLESTQPLLVRHDSKVRKNGDFTLALFLNIPNSIKMLLKYVKSNVPEKHFWEPLGDWELPALRFHQDGIRHFLSIQEPPLPEPVVKAVDDDIVPQFDLAIAMANVKRLKDAAAPLLRFVEILDEVCLWKNFLFSLFVNIIFITMAFKPFLIVSFFTLYLFYLFVKGYIRHVTRWKLPEMDAGLFGGFVDANEIQEEEEEKKLSHDTPLNAVTEKLRQLEVIGGKVQNILGEVAAVMEKLRGTVNWNDPLISLLFTIILALAVPGVLFAPLVLSYVLAFAFFWILRHPILRDPIPPPPVFLFMRMPSRSDYLL